MEWVAEYSGDLNPPLQAKRKYQARKKEFIGWGSRNLIDFLGSIGKDTSHRISQDDAADIITDYINEHKLTDPDKKKRVNCDDRLVCLFGRKKLVKFSRIKIYNLLSAHYAKEEKAADDDHLLSSEDEDMPAKCVQYIPQRRAQKKRILQIPTSPFAAIIPENLKLVYLRKSLVQDLLKDFDTFEQKVIGSFVRVKSDPNDYLQKNPYQLLQVTGIRKASGGTKSNEVVLRVPVRDIRISMLSDDNFTEEECEELCQKIKDGAYKKLTILELEEKVRVLHEDITKHWLVRELALLQNLIERANEKGWRKESLTLAEYLDRKQVLQTPAEQSRLVREIPKVTPEQIKEDSTVVPEFPEDDVDSYYSSESPHGDSPEIAKTDAVPNGAAASAGVMDFAGHEKQLLGNSKRNREEDTRKELNFTKGFEGSGGKLQEASRMIDFSLGGCGKSTFNITSHGASGAGSARGAFSSDEYWQAIEVNVNGRENPAIMDLNKSFEGAAMDTNQVIGFSSLKPDTSREFSASLNGANDLTGFARGNIFAEHSYAARLQENLQNRPFQTTPSIGQRPWTVDLNSGAQVTMEKKPEPSAHVIDLISDDDEENNPVRNPSPPPPPPPPPQGNGMSSSFNLGGMIWYYADPQGYQQGPFSLLMLKQWDDRKYFPPGFKVWMMGQNPSEAAPLTDILRIVFP